MVIWEVLSVFGNVFLWIGIVLFSLMFSFVIPRKKKKYVMLLSLSILIGVMVSSLIAYGMKFIFKTPRPCFGLSDCPESYSFPSGHAAVIFAVVTVLVPHLKNRRFSLLLFVFASLVATSRLMLNVHRLEDVLVGCLIGIITGVLVKNYLKSIKK